jgi:predicted nuclease of predicted toxin-antitoxin system
LKLLLDEMWAPSIADVLRQRGHDVVAVAVRADLRGQPDDVIFAAAVAEGYAIVTENVADYRPLAAAAVRAGRPLPALVFTANRSFPRGGPRTGAFLVAALDELLRGNEELAGELWLQLRPSG